MRQKTEENKEKEYKKRMKIYRIPFKELICGFTGVPEETERRRWQKDFIK